MTSTSSDTTNQFDIPQNKILSVKELLQADTRSVPPVLLEQSMGKLDNIEVPREIFFSKDYHDLEVEKLWKKIWQYVCREEDIPAIGDYIVYDIAELSVLVVRSSSTRIQAFYNSCLHRGTQLQVEDGKTTKLQCPFHGWTWKLDGRLAHIPCRWDFEGLSDEDWRLPEVKLATWQGFVFINFDNDCEPLETYLENIPSHFQHFPVENRFTSAYVAKIMPANWKVTLAAFLEAYHSLATHPQIVPFTGDTNSQYDIYGRHNRMITPFAVASPHLQNQKDEQAIAQAMVKFQGGDPSQVKVPEGMTARAFMAEGARKMMSKQLGVDCSAVSDCEMLDAISYFIFPNFMSWPGIGAPIQFRFRPNGNDPDSSILDIRLLQPCPPGKQPPAAQIHWLKPEDSWAKAPELGTLGPFFDQDSSNLHRLQKGLKASGKTNIVLGKYQESRIRHFYQILHSQLNG